jgi:hypothetical protein
VGFAEGYPGGAGLRFCWWRGRRRGGGPGCGNQEAKPAAHGPMEGLVGVEAAVGVVVGALAENCREFGRPRELSGHYQKYGTVFTGVESGLDIEFDDVLDQPYRRGD